ncbi:hypothetical protein CJF31_00011055 [Rutstroemia sp. NJR-2017a BVV2]|nr:hypothetical protein CJF31_00011055 [Rutstroemia sp. NJR-2017a BVV2]
MAPEKPSIEDAFRRKRKSSNATSEPRLETKKIATTERRGSIALVDQHQLHDSSFNIPFASPVNTPSKAGYISDITKYIPAGCIRIVRNECAILQEVAEWGQFWQAFMHPRDIYNLQAARFLPNEVQEKLSSSSFLNPFRGLHNAGWIRMEFKANDKHTGQVRVYILPDDVGRASIDRKIIPLRKSLQLLVAQLDISQATWKGQWTEGTPIKHIDPSLNTNNSQDYVSLFDMFNDLPTPNPDPSIVLDEHVKDAMYALLEGSVAGLDSNTQMHPYQCRSAALMLQRETEPAQILDPRLRVIKDLKGQDWYCDLHAVTCFKEPRFYETPKGGICAENMGLGKTLICLALILATKHLSSKAPVEYSVGSIPVRKTTGSLMDMAASTIGRTGTPWKKDLTRLEFEHGYEFSRVRTALKQGAGFYWLPPARRRRQTRNPTPIPPRKIWLTNATLVVVPANLISQWKEEIKKHAPGLDFFIVDSPKTTLPPAQELADFDLILFSKPAFEKEFRDRGDESTSPSCTCSDAGGIHEADCGYLKGSPLKDLHFKRLITDEGHNFGNASKSSMTEAVIAVDSLQLDARWIISGTPTQGLYGVDEAASSINKRSLQFSDSSNSSEDTDGHQVSRKPSLKQEKLFFQQERKDLEKLGNIATMYLKARPWANTVEDRDMASWSTLIMQPRHGRKSHGDAAILKSTLEGMIIRHRAADVSKELQLPPLRQKIVYLDGSMQDKLSLNMFSMMIISNAVTSERKDADYLFHPRQRSPLQTLVSNLRQASFHWSGYTTDMVQSTVDISKRFLEERKVPVTPEDAQLLRQAIQMGEVALSNGIFRVVSKIHEMTMYVQNDFDKTVAAAWALDGDHRKPTLMGAHMITEAQKFLDAQVVEGDPQINFTEEGIRVMKTASPGIILKPQAKKTRKAPTLAGGVTVEEPSRPGINSSPRKSIGSSDSSEEASLGSDNKSGGSATDDLLLEFEERREKNNKVVEADFLDILNTLYHGTFTPIYNQVDYFEPERKALTASVEAASIISTASAKLSYLMDQIHLYHENEKIIVFYEAENVAYYIAQALECMNIQHLIYAKSLSTSRRSQYVVTFNQTPHFRVLLMDVQQAAFGLDMSAASRVYFVNPVFSPQVEAQAVKRAHRIGQLKPVYVETLVLKGSIEEAIVRRRDHMTNQEHNKLKTILDDNTMYEWIKNVRFSPLPTESTPGPNQMAELKYPQPFLTPRLLEREVNPGFALHRKENRKDLKYHRREFFRAILRFQAGFFNADPEVVKLLENIKSLPINVRQMIARHFMGRDLLIYYRSHWRGEIKG